MSTELFTAAYRELVDDTVVQRFALLDDLIANDNFLIGLSSQSSSTAINSHFVVVSDIVLGTQFYSSQTKPRKHKGEFSSFDGVISQIDYIATCLSGKTSDYRDATNKDTEADKTHGLLEELRTVVRSRVVELQLFEHFSARPEVKKAKNSKAENLVQLVEDMVYAYFFYLRRFAHLADFSDITLCNLFVEQLRTGGLPCGWLSRRPYWDLSDLESHTDYDRKTYPSMHHGVFAHPTDKLAMLYLD